MKRVALFVLAGSFLFAAAAQAAPDRVGRLGIGVLAGAAIGESKIDDAAFFAGSLDWGLNRNWAIGVDGGWYEAGGNTDDERIGIVHGLFDIIVREPDFHDNFVPYGVLGLGVIGAYVEDSEGNEPDNSGDDTDDIGFGWKLGFGIEYFMKTDWVLVLEAAYYGVDVNLGGSSAGDDGLDHWKIGGGLKKIF